MSYLIHDCETSIVNSYKRKANPFDPSNHVVANGFKRKGGKTFTHYYGRDKSAKHMPILPEDKLLVGFNYKFDLLWHWERPELKKFLKEGGRIWCCQYAEYLLNGQIPSSQMVSMDSIVERYGGKLKIDEVKELWKAGVETVDIPKDLLLRYLGGDDGDIENTEKIFLGQVARAREQGQLIDIMQRMEGLLATTEMEYNGLFVNLAVAEQDQRMLEGELKALSKELEDALPEMPEGFTFNWGSNIHKSCLLFGGTVSYEKWAPHLDDKGQQLYAQMEQNCYIALDGRLIPCDGVDALGDGTQRDKVLGLLERFKGGKRQGELKTKKRKVDDPSKPKGAQKKFFFKFDRITEPDDEWKGKLTDAEDGPIYSTNKDVIEALGNTDIAFLKALSNREKIAKDLGTYYLTEDKDGNKTGMLTCVMPDGIIHHKLNHTITVTTRLSSSDPNLQNVPRPDFDKMLGRAKSVVKRMFTSRFGSDGIMAEIDYSQLEVVVQGLLTNDPTLIADIQAKVDFHCKRLSAKLKEEYAAVKSICSDEEHPEYAIYKLGRTKIKEFTFQRAYGAGAKGIAAATGMDIEEVELLITTEERLYPGITKYYDAVQAAIEASRYPTNVTEELPDKPGVYVQCGRGYYMSPTQARFVFTEVPNQAWLRSKTGRDASFYRPHIQNYPIQGVGGQLVQYVLGRLFRLFLATDNFGGRCLMVNTVHDCVWFDMRDRATAQEVIPQVVAIMESIPAILKELYNINCTVPFPVEAEVGANMLDLEHFKMAA